MVKKCESRQILSFGRYARGHSRVAVPTTPKDVIKLFAEAHAQKKRPRIIIRGGGHSFDGQAVHDKDKDSKERLIISSEGFAGIDRIKWEPDRKVGRVRLGAGVTWGQFVAASIERALKEKRPIQLPGSMQTGALATVGGTLAGDCLSRFSGTVGKESAWIESFELITPVANEPIEVSQGTDTELFNAVVGGHGYLGFVTEATYRLVDVPIFPVGDIVLPPVARTVVTRSESSDLIEMLEEQKTLVDSWREGDPPRAISSAAFTIGKGKTLTYRSGIFDSTYAQPTGLRSWPLYGDIESPLRVVTEVMARLDLLNDGLHNLLDGMASGSFEDKLKDFIFFMDGNTYAKEKYEKFFQGSKPEKSKFFHIIQQTWVIPAEKSVANAAAFAQECCERLDEEGIDSTEFDILYSRADDCLMSGTYKTGGFAITLGFEDFLDRSKPPRKIVSLLKEFNEQAIKLKGRLHLTKNAFATDGQLRRMFSASLPDFEGMKRQCDPDGLIRNEFWDRLLATKQTRRTRRQR